MLVIVHRPVVGTRSKAYICQERKGAHCILVTMISPKAFMLPPKFNRLVGGT
jgi:hypothetical protein